MYVYVGVDTRWYRHLSHLGGYAAKAWEPCNGDETPAWRPNLQTFWSLNRQCHMHTNLPQWNKWTVGRTTLRLSMQNREIEALCMTKHDECRGADLQLRLHQHITKCINMHRNGEIEQGDIKAHSSSFLSSLMFHGNLCFFSVQPAKLVPKFGEELQRQLLDTLRDLGAVKRLSSEVRQIRILWVKRVDHEIRW